MEGVGPFAPSPQPSPPKRGGEGAGKRNVRSRINRSLTVAVRHSFAVRNVGRGLPSAQTSEPLIAASPMTNHTGGPIGARSKC